MKADIAKLMRCVYCGGGKIELMKKDSNESIPSLNGNFDIQNGMVRCSQCLHLYKITDGVATTRFGVKSLCSP